MALLQVDNLTLQLGDRTLLDGVNLTLSAGEHVGMVGRNGCGKSTLLKLIAQQTDLKADSGHIHIAHGASVGYLHQDHQLNPAQSMREAAAGQVADLGALEEELGQLAERMADPEEDMDALLARYDIVERRLAAGGADNRAHEVEATLHGLGLKDASFDVPCSELSGGQRARVALARVLLAQPDILLLDEPTNHLDIAGRQWLETFLGGYQGAVIVISHDRWLLNRAVNKIFEIEHGRLITYPGHYDKFRELRQARLEDQRRLYDKQQSEIAKERDFIARFKAGQRAKQARGRETRLERMLATEKLELPPELDVMKLQLTPGERSGDIVLQCEGLSVTHEQRTLFHNLDLTLKRGERLGIIGPNGSGKSTLIRCLLGEQDATEGKTRIGAKVDHGHFKQDHSHLIEQETVVETLQKVVPEQHEQLARDLAGAFLFSGVEQDKQVSSLSGGERARLVLAGLMSEGHNLLVLDEPTNHLDIPGTERLEQALLGYASSKVQFTTSGRSGGEGTLVLISHDRMLLDDLVTRLLIFDDNGQVEHYPGTYSEWVASRGHEVLHNSDAPQTGAKRKQPEKKRGDAKKAAAKATQQARQQKTPAPATPAQKRRNTPFGGMATSRLEEKIIQVEAQKNDLEAQLADPAVYADTETFEATLQQLEKIQKDLELLEEEWATRE